MYPTPSKGVEAIKRPDNSDTFEPSAHNNSSEQVIIQEIRKSETRIVKSLRNRECQPGEVVQEVFNPFVHEEAHQLENEGVEIYKSTSVNENHEASVESLEGEWNEVRNPSKPFQEIDTLIVGDSVTKDIKASLMSASNVIRKQCLCGAKVEECKSKVEFSAYKCKKAISIHLRTNNITTDDLPKTIASKLAEVGKAVQPSAQAPSIIISDIIPRKDTTVDSEETDTNCEIKSVCVKMRWKFVNNDGLNESCPNGSKLHLNRKGSAYLATNFLKALNTIKQNIKETSWTKDNHQNFWKTKALLTSLILGLL